MESSSGTGSIVYADYFDEIYPYIEPYREICLVVDSNLRYVIDEMVHRLDADGRLKCLYVFEASEANKTLASVEDLIREMVSSDLGRNVLVIAVGGGITTDFAGFAASVYKRGVRFALVPTTLLAQSDAAIGGKTGVNFDGYKNMVGVFRSPEFTFICPEVLKTLPTRQILSGSAEILKTFIIGDADAYSRAVHLLSSCHIRVSGEKQPSAGNNGRSFSEEIPLPCGVKQTYCADNSSHKNGVHCGEDFWKELAQLSARAASIKSEIVEKDPYENGLRRVLNLGHTFGHAIEALSAERHYDIIHGEAVAMGMILAARLGAGLRYGSAADGVAADDIAADDVAAEDIVTHTDAISAYNNAAISVEQLEEDFAAAGLPVQSPFTLSELAPFMCKDKKAESGSVHFVIPESIGRCVVREMSVKEAVDTILMYGRMA